ncbi:unnamed protein product [Pleuronectes platessa]|uniref:Uncharacterized protein n=1 Tax=Pleuronectes platessa TaxID=8262 RepID=A0A9N7YCR0_PLEPL|nr:unnamed protein product [Pleuronectes platessa]
MPMKFSPGSTGGSMMGALHVSQEPAEDMHVTVNQTSHTFQPTSPNYAAVKSSGQEEEQHQPQHGSVRTGKEFRYTGGLRRIHAEFTRTRCGKRRARVPTSAVTSAPPPSLIIYGKSRGHAPRGPSESRK